MTKLTALIAGLAVVTAAAAAQAEPAQIRVADLNLATTKGVATYFHRVDKIAYRMCSEGHGPALRNLACEAAVKAEAGEKLAAIQSTTQFAKR
jgi:UrcA family protein